MFLLLISLSSCAYYLKHEEKSFLSWMRANNQFYTGDEYQIRFGIFLSNLRLIKEHNSNNKGFTVGLNRFAAYTPSEYKEFLGFRMKRAKSAAPVKSSKKKTDFSFDWRTRGIICSVKDQGQCGSCWAFSAIEAAESSYAISTGVCVLFSAQNLVDCVTTCSGCNGGLMTEAYDYVMQNQGGQFCRDDSYPYTAVEGTCKYSDAEKVGRILRYINIEEGNEDDLCDKVKDIGPVAVAIDASNWSFQMYSSGIYDEPSCSPTNLDHGVLLVGYGIEGTTSYWIVENSWGTSWGEGGYIRMLWKDNQCGIATMATVPVLY